MWDIVLGCVLWFRPGGMVAQTKMVTACDFVTSIGGVTMAFSNRNCEGDFAELRGHGLQMLVCLPMQLQSSSVPLYPMSSPLVSRL
jgi:hypothetical protein